MTTPDNGSGKVTVEFGDGSTTQMSRAAVDAIGALAARVEAADQRKEES